MQVVRATVGMCKDCGYTWHTDGSTSTKKNNSMLWWVLGWIFFFPAPVMVLIWRKKCKLDIKVKIGLTVAFWVLFFAIGASGDSSDTSSTATTTDIKIEDTTATESNGTVSATIEPNVNDDDGTVLFGVITNLPKDTKLTLTLTNDNGYSAEQTVTILKTGTGYTSEFDDNGAGLNGKYEVTVTDVNGTIIAIQSFTF